MEKPRKQLFFMYLDLGVNQVATDVARADGNGRKNIKHDYIIGKKSVRVKEQKGLASNVM
jgi:hypothetical protein